MKLRVRSWNKRKATGAMKCQEEGGNFGRSSARQHIHFEGKFVLVEFLTAMKNIEIWRCTAE